MCNTEGAAYHQSQNRARFYTHYAHFECLKQTWKSFIFLKNCESSRYIANEKNKMQLNTSTYIYQLEHHI